MNIDLREWKIEDAPDLAAAINNKKVLDNLRDGIPYPYTEKDAKEFITAMRSADKNAQYAVLKPPTIRPLDKDDVISAMELVLRIFMEFEAPEYAEEGVAEFQAFIEPSTITSKMESGEFLLWGAFYQERVVGIIAIKPSLHISLMFVDKQYHRRGIARRLFDTVLNCRNVINGHDRVTVNSSPYAVNVYRRLGFQPTGTEQTINGLRFTPMEYTL